MSTDAAARIAIAPYRADQLGGVAAVCETSLRALPFGFTVTLREVADWLGGESDRLDHDATYVAVADGTVAGWARIGSGGPSARTQSWHTAGPGEGVVRALFAEPGKGAEEALVRHAAVELQRWGCERLWAFEDDLGPPFYNGGFGRLSLRLPAIVSALTATSFAVHELEVQLELDLSAISPVPQHPSLRVASGRTPTGEIADEAVGADGEWVGQCVWAPMSLRSRDPEAARYGYVWWLGVREEFRGHGHGRWLLHHVLDTMRARGLDTARLTTAASNTRAQTLYFSMGFRVVDASAVLLREPGARG